LTNFIVYLFKLRSEENRRRTLSYILFQTRGTPNKYVGLSFAKSSSILGRHVANPMDPPALKNNYKFEKSKKKKNVISAKTNSLS